jgi:hypothetical protein
MTPRFSQENTGKKYRVKSLKNKLLIKGHHYSLKTGKNTEKNLKNKLRIKGHHYSLKTWKNTEWKV